MAACDYCTCAVCGGKSFYDARMEFGRVKVDGSVQYLTQRCGDYAGLCLECAKSYQLVAIPRPARVDIEWEE